MYLENFLWSGFCNKNLLMRASMVCLKRLEYEYKLYIGCCINPCTFKEFVERKLKANEK